MRPDSLFDTELAGRLVGLPPRRARPAGRAAARACRLEKGHGAADWSRRPLPDDWLVYAALDVEVLVELRDVLAADLERAGQDRVGRAGVRGRAHSPARPRRGPSRGAAPRACTRCAGPRARRRPRAVGVPRRARRRARHRPRPRAARRRDRRRRPARARRAARRSSRCRCSAGAPSAAWRVAGGRRSTRRPRAGPRRSWPAAAAAARRPAARARWGDKDPAAAARLAAARAALAGPLRAHRHPGGEPAAARPRAPPVLVAARADRRRRVAAALADAAAPARGRWSSPHRCSPRP